VWNFKVKEIVVNLNYHLKESGLTSGN